MNALINCICCGSQLTYVKSVKVYKSWHCKRCEFVTIYPLPLYKDVEEFYGNQYFKKLIPENVIRSKYEIADLRLKFIDNFNKLKKKSILEIGCAGGQFLETAYNDGWITSGVEINSEMREKAREYSTENRIVKSIDDVKGKYSVIAAWEVLEHMLDPVNDILTIKTKLTADGLLCLSFPNIECKKSIKSKLAWEQFKPPEHLHYWQASNIELLLNNHGFSVVGVRYHGINILVEGIDLLGNRSNKKTILWPIMSIVYRILRPLYSTGIKKQFSRFIRKNYNGIEIYAYLEK